MAQGRAIREPVSEAKAELLVITPLPVKITDNSAFASLTGYLIALP